MKFNPTKPARVGVDRHVAVVKTEHEVIVLSEGIVRLRRLDASMVDAEGLALRRPMKGPPSGHAEVRQQHLAVLHLHHQMFGTTLNGTHRRTDKPGLKAFRERKTEVGSTLINGDHTTTGPRLREAATNGLDLRQFRHVAASPQQRGDACPQIPRGR